MLTGKGAKLPMHRVIRIFLTRYWSSPLMCTHARCRGIVSRQERISRSEQSPALCTCCRCMPCCRAQLRLQSSRACLMVTG